MDQKEANELNQMIDEATRNQDIHSLLGILAAGILRIAAAQEKMVELAVEDMNGQIEEAVQARAEERAQEMDEEKTKRSYIGRK